MISHNQQVAWSASKTKTECSSRYKGIYWNRERRKWHVRIMVRGQRIHIGYFDNEIEAAIAYDRFARNYFGEFAKCNF